MYSSSAQVMSPMKKQEIRAAESFRLTCSNCETTHMRERRYHPVTQLAICPNCFNYYKIHKCNRPSHFEYRISGRKENKNADKSKGVKRFKTRSEYKITKICCLCTSEMNAQYFQCPFTARPMCQKCFQEVRVMKRGAPLKNTAAIRYKHGGLPDEPSSQNNICNPMQAEHSSAHNAPNHHPSPSWGWNYWNSAYDPNYAAPLYPNYQFQQPYHGMHYPYPGYHNHQPTYTTSVNETSTQSQHSLGLVTTEQIPLLDLCDADFQ